MSIAHAFLQFSNKSFVAGHSLVQPPPPPPTIPSERPIPAAAVFPHFKLPTHSLGYVRLSRETKAQR